MTDVRGVLQHVQGARAPWLSGSTHRRRHLAILPAAQRASTARCFMYADYLPVCTRTQYVRLYRPAAVCSTTLLLCYYVLLLFYVLLCFMCGVSQLVPEAPPRLHRASVTPRPWSLGELLVTEARPRLGGASGRGRSSPRRHRASDRKEGSDQGRTEPRGLVVLLAPTLFAQITRYLITAQITACLLPHYLSVI